MAGMHRDKCGAAAVAGFFQVSFQDYWTFLCIDKYLKTSRTLFYDLQKEKLSVVYLNFLIGFYFKLYHIKVRDIYKLYLVKDRFSFIYCNFVFSKDLFYLLGGIVCKHNVETFYLVKLKIVLMMIFCMCSNPLSFVNVEAIVLYMKKVKFQYFLLMGKKSS